MKIKLLIVLLLVSVFGYAQTVVYSDNMEDTGWTWKGIPRVLLNSYYTGGNSGATNFPASSNYYSSFDSCFALFGTGLGSSTIERDTLSYLNVTGLDPTVYYRFRFKVASFALNPTVNTAAGVDGPDFVQIDYSSNGGVSFIRELKLTGNSNSRWSFVGGIALGKAVNGTLSTSIVGTPITTLFIDLPVGITQFAANIILSCNATGETWMIDDVELVKVTALPVELLYFEAKAKNNTVYLNWATASEINNDRFEIYKSIDNIDYKLLTTVYGKGTTTQTNYYSIKDNDVCGILYYKLKQIDYDGVGEEFNPVVVQIYSASQLDTIKVTNILGQEVDENYSGFKMYIVK